MRTLNWNAKRASALRMGCVALEYAIRDCHDAAVANRGAEEGYYMDELSVYEAEACNRVGKSAPFSGWGSWGEWNVALWLSNTEWLSRMVDYSIRRAPNTKAGRRQAVQAVRDALGVGAKTPDGAPYTIKNIKAYVETIWGEVR